MNQLRKVEKILKGCLKDRRRVTLALLVSFLINGGLSYASENIKVSQGEEKNALIMENRNENNDSKITHIDIAAPNDNGVSHNKYDKFSIEKDEKVIFNNKNIRDEIGANLDPTFNKINEGLTGGNKKAADLIISEVVGNEKSKFNGELEVYGKEADLIFANENGIDINGQKFINAGDVAFVTQKGLDSWDKNTLKNNDFSTNDKVNIEKGTITVGKEGIKLSEENKSNFKLIAEKIEVDGEIGKFGNKGNIELHSGKTKNISQENISGGIKLTGSMYGNNIVIRNYGGSNGIELAGSIEAKDQIDIDSKTGKIIIKEKIEAKKVNVTSAGGQKDNNEVNNQNSPLLEIKEEGKLYGHEKVEITARSAKDIQSKGEIHALDNSISNEKKVILNFKDSGTLSTEELPKDYTLESQKSALKTEKEDKNKDSSLKKLLSTVKNGDEIDITFDYTSGSSKKYVLKKKANGNEESEKELNDEEAKKRAKEEAERIEKEKKEREEKEKKLKEEEEKKRKEIELKEKAEKEKREKEEAERKLKEEELKKKQKEEELAKKKAKEEEERKAREKAEKERLEKEEKDRKAREEAELKEKQLKEKEEAEKRAREEKERLQKEEEARRKAEQERLEKQKELEKKQKEEELAKKKAKEEKDKYDQLNSKNVVIDSSKGSENSTKLKITEEEMKLREKGTVVVDISQANEGKISHNYYTRFTIPKTNNVLLNNNSTDEKVKSKLESYEVGKNENLKTGDADLIINEVNNSKNSEITELAGGLEVLGQKADVVVANENGILVNGGKFVNTNRLALSTGKFSKKGEKELEFGARKGNIDIQDKLNTDHLDLYSKNINVKGEIETQFLQANADENITNNDGVIKAKNAVINAGNSVINENKGLIFTDEKLSIKAKEVQNKNSTIYSKGDSVIEGTKKIENVDSVITSKGKLILKGQNIDNITSDINSEKDLVIKTDKLKNEGKFTSTVEELKEGKTYKRKIRVRESYWKSWYNGYILGITLPKENLKIKVKDSTIYSNDRLLISSFKDNDPKKTHVINKDAALISRGNMLIDGDVENVTSFATRSADELLSRIKLDFFWNTSSLVDGSVFSKGNEGLGISLKDALGDQLHRNYGKYYSLLRGADIPQLDKVLNLTLGGDWKAKEEIPPVKTDGQIRYVSNTSRATISSRGNIVVNGKVLNSEGSDYLENYEGRKNHKEKDAPIEYEFLSNKVNDDIITEEEKARNTVEEAEKYLERENGLFKKANNEEYLYKTSDLIGEQSGKAYSFLKEELKKKNVNVPNDRKVIGDAYYQRNMIANMIREKTYLKLNPDSKRIDYLLKAAAEEGKRLDLVIGKPLTTEQLKNLERDIVWYVDSIVDGKKVLIPVVYLIEEFTGVDKTVSAITAGENVITEGEEFKNKNSSVFAGENVDVTSDNFSSKGNKTTKTSVAAGKNLKIEAKKKAEIEFSELKALGNMDISADILKIKASDLEAKEKAKLKSKTSTTIENEIEVESETELTNKTGAQYNVEGERRVYREKNIASNIKGKNVEIESDGDINVKGSNIKAEESAEISGKKVNIEASKTKEIEHSHQKGSGINSQGLLEFNTEETTNRESEKANGSSIDAGKNLSIKAKEELNIKGSDIKAGKSAKLSGKKVTIENETETIKEETNKESAQLLGYTNESRTSKSTKAKASTVTAGDGLVIEAEEEAKIKGSKIKAAHGYIDAKKSKIEAAEETHEETTSKTSLGFTASGSAGVLGVGVEGEANGADKVVDGRIVNEYQNKKLSQGTNGGRKSSALAEADVGLEFSYKKSKKEEQKWKNSTVETTDGSLNILAKEENDIGGADLSSKGDTNIVGKKVTSTKQKNVTKEESYGFEISAKQSAGTTSSIVDAVTAGKEIADDAKKGELNEGLAAAKTIGAVTGLLFNDLAGVQSKQSLNFAYNQSESKVEEDTKSSIKTGGKLLVKSTEEDIELKNIDIKAKEKVTLDSERDIKISDGKRKETRRDHSFRAEAHLQESAGVGAISGGNTQVGIGGSASYEKNSLDNETSESSNIVSKDLNIRSKRDTEIKGGNVRAEENATAKVGGKLTVKSEVDKYNEQRVKANAGLSGSVGVASNTLVTGNGSLSAGAGSIWKEGEKIESRSGLTAGRKMNLEVGGDLEVDSASIGADTKKGNLKVEGEIKTKDRITKERAGGAIVGGSAGLTGEIGIDLEIGDKRNREVNSKTVLSFEKENISTKKVTHNDKESNIDSIENDMSNENQVLKNEYKKGGTANLSFSVNDSKQIAGAVKSAATKAKNHIQKSFASNNNSEVSAPRQIASAASAETIRNQVVSQETGNSLAKRDLPKLPGEESTVTKKTRESDYESIEEIRSKVATQETGNSLAKRELPKLPGEESTVTKKTRESDYESIEEIRSKVAETKEAENKVTAKKTTEDIYAQVDFSKKKPKEETAESLAEKARQEEVRKNEELGVKRSVISEDNSDYMTIKRVKEEVQKQKDEINRPKNETDSGEVKGKNPARRELPKLPGEETVVTKKVRESDYESIEEIRSKVATQETGNSLAKRELPKLPGEESTVTKKTRESDYESIEEIRSKVAETKEAENKVTTKKTTEDIYAQVDFSKKKPKEETAESLAEKARQEEVRKNEELGVKRSVISEDNSDYMTIKRVKEEVQKQKDEINRPKNETDSGEVKGKNPARRELPKLPGEESTVTKKTRESDYESIEEIRSKVAETKEAENKVTTKKTTEDIYAQVDFSKKKPKEETAESLAEKARQKEVRKNEELGVKRSVISEDNSDYMTIKRVKEEVQKQKDEINRPKNETDSGEVKGKNPARRELPKLPGEETAVTKKTRESDYESIEEIRSKVATQETGNSLARRELPKLPGEESTVTKKTRESDYESIEEIKNQIAALNSNNNNSNITKKEVSNEENSLSEKSKVNISESVENATLSELKDRKLPKFLREEINNSEKTVKTDSSKSTDNLETKIDSKKLFEEARKKAKERDNAKEAEKKLKLLAENAENIPKEHLLKALKELAYGLSMEDAIALREKSKETGKKIHRPDTIEGFEGKNVTNMGKVFQKIQFDPEYIKTREDINQRIVEKLDSNKEFHTLMKQKLSGNEEGIKKLFDLVEKAKYESLKEITGIDGKRVDLNIYKSSPLSMKQGYYKDDVVNMGSTPLLSFARTQKQNNKEILNTLIHELTHHDQAQIRNNRNKDIPKHMVNDSDLLILNETYYIDPHASVFKSYKEQPMEREAFLSGDKLGEKLSKLVDKEYSKRNNEISEIIHIPSKNKNLEASREAEANFGDSALIYGLKDGRKELMSRANKADAEKKNPIIADSYVGELNLGFEFARLSELASKVNSGKLSSEDIDAIANYRDPNLNSAVSDSMNRINKTNLDDNKEVISDLLNNEKAIEALKKMDNLNRRQKELTEILRNNENVNLDNPVESQNLSPEQNAEIREYNQIKKGLNDARMDFFAEKTKLIAKKVLDEGGQIYFSLDGLMTDTMKYNKDKTTIDVNRLKEVFDPTNEHYNSVTSKELRYLYENYKDHPNLKFMIKDQIIENPLKTLVIPKSETKNNSGESSDGERARSLLPKLFSKTKENKGPVIKHLGADETKDSFYFPLDKIVTKNGNISKDMNVNLENIKKAFNPNDRHYNSPEAKSLRASYEQDNEMKGIKFIIGNQVIENPFKSEELQNYIKSQQEKTKLKKELPKQKTKKEEVNGFYPENKLHTRSDKLAEQVSTVPNSEPVYADIQFKNNKNNKNKKSQITSEETIYEDIKGFSGKTSIYENVNKQQEKVKREKINDFYPEDKLHTRSDKLAEQVSTVPNSEPVYADIQFKNNKNNKNKKGQITSEETIYEDIKGFSGKTSIYENINKQQEKVKREKINGFYPEDKLHTRSDKLAEQVSTVPNSEPVYADIQFKNNKNNKNKKSQITSEEIIYEDIKSFSNEPIYQNLPIKKK